MADRQTDYRETLNLPKTPFPQRAQLPKREPEFLSFWKDIDLYGKMRASREGAPKFILHDGPPYANGGIHVGTALNKILKDIVVRSQFLLGKDVPFVPGWDCHGLPIELGVTGPLEKKGKTVPRTVLRRLCKEYALKFMNIQRDQFKRLGCVGDWDNPYLTLKPDYEAEELLAFATMVDQGMVYHGLKPIQWCPSCHTALAEAEVEYEDHSSPSIYVKFPVIPESLEGKKLSDALADTKVLIWTTTPWTIPANLAICLHPEFNYSIISADGEKLLLASDLVSRVVMETGLGDCEEIERIKGTDLEGIACRHPFIDRKSVLILGDHVTLEQGTGCVHTAPGHGAEDYIVGQKYKLDVYSPVDDDGKFTEEFPEFAGQGVMKANRGINDLLREKGALLHESEYHHSYPHCWRCKGPIIFRATPQWFISLEVGNLRDRILEEIDRVTWVPSYGRERIRSMVELRHEWCISRQRTWGVPIPALYCRKCGQVQLEAGFVRALAEIVRTEGCDVWFAALDGDAPESLKQLLDETKCRECGETDLRMESDILDVWYDSGTSHQGVLRRHSELSYPADLYLEGSDQHRGWFQSSLSIAVAINQGAPYRKVLTTGFTVDEDGRKMSKSIGNFIPIEELLEQNGADILRLWVASEDFRQDISISQGIIKRLTQTYFRIRNTCRYLLGNLHDFAWDHAVAEEDMNEIDRWALSRLRRVGSRCSEAYESFEYHRIFHTINNFCTVDLSSVYLDILKDRLYTFPRDSRSRRSAQTVMARIATDLARILSPILSFTAEEVWQELRNIGLAKEESVALTAWEEDTGKIDDEFMERWEHLFALRREVQAALEILRKDGVIGSSLEAEVVLHTENDRLRDLLARYVSPPHAGDDLASIFITSRADVADKELEAADEDGVFRSPAKGLDGVVIEVRKTGARKCARCWRREESVPDEEGGVCQRCEQALDGTLA
jgi:isoleucyl-tRNA synthetase